MAGAEGMDMAARGGIQRVRKPSGSALLRLHFGVVLAAVQLLFRVARLETSTASASRVVARAHLGRILD